MLSRLNFWLFLPLFVSLAGCATQGSPHSKTIVNGVKTVGYASRFQLIDDFNSGIDRTKVDTEWKTSEPDGGTIKLFSNEEDALNRGGSLVLEYDIPAHGRASCFTVLNGLDVSQADSLVLLIRKKELEAFSGTISLELRDNTGKKFSAGVPKLLRQTQKGPKGDWIKVKIQRRSYRALDFNQLERFEIILTTAATQQKGRLVVDEIGFYGSEELIFKSNRDNLLGFPEININEERRKELLAVQDSRKFLELVARDSWLYFENLIDTKTHLPIDHIRVGGTLGIGSYVSPTNIALYWLCNVAAYDLSLISKQQAVENIRSSLESFEKLNRWGGGFWYNFYQTRNLRVTRQYVSAVDNGWLAAALVVVRQAFPDAFRDKASELLKHLNFSDFYDPSNGQLRLGFDAEKGAFSPYHYGLLVTEARLASYVAIGKKDLKKEHWTRIYRTLPQEWDWQKQVPAGTERILFGHRIFEGVYTYLDKKFVPSWGGSLFEFLAPALILEEQELAPRGLGKNNQIATDLQIEYALHQKMYPVWGIAPASVGNGRAWVYREYGVPGLGAKGYPDQGVIAPYASFLALATRPEAAIRNLREMLTRYPDVYGEYGFYDSVNVIKQKVNHQFLLLDQAMSFLAIANYLKDGTIRKHFHADPIGREGEVLLREESFSI